MRPRSSCNDSGPHHIETIEEYRALYKKSIEDPAGFWGEIAKQFHWHEPWDEEAHLAFNFDTRKGRIGTRFFHKGKTNICFNSLDRHVAAGHGDR